MVWPLLPAPLFCLLAACGSAVGAPTNETAAPQAKGGTGMELIPATSTSTSSFALGVNVNTPDIWQNSRPFMNLIYGTPAQMQNTAPYGSGEDIPASSLDANGWVKSVPAGYRVMRGLSIPAAGGDIVCHYQGNGTLTVTNGPATNINSSAGVLRFTLAPANPADQKAISLAYFVDPANYIRNIDCREATASTTTDIAPEFMSTLNGFKVVRFMKWQRASEANNAVTWATRNKPGDADFYVNDGVPIEYIVEAANQADADPWVTVPWNADNDYITRFATYVRDNMAPGHKVYVETSNEVWNGMYPVYAQAKAEAAAEGLKSSEDGVSPGSAAERYAEKTRQVMQIWSTVFAGQTGRLVRVFAFQHVQPYWSDKLLAYQSTYQSVDALATAPYFGHDAPTWAVGQSLDSIMNTILPGKISEQLAFGVQQKAIAQKYGLQYVTYEAGQHVVLPNNLPLLTQIEGDSRMYDLYNSFIGGWQSQVGGLLTMFALQGPVSQYGAWGMSDYANEPLTQSPKRRAVQAFLGTSTASTTTPPTLPPPSPVLTPLPTSPAPVVVATTQTCWNGSVIPLTSTCPSSPKKNSKKNGVAIG